MHRTSPIRNSSLANASFRSVVAAAVVVVSLLIGTTSAVGQIGDDPYTSTVGFPKQIRDVQISGGRMDVLPIQDREQPIILRIVDVRPHGSDFMYDFEYTGLEPGTRNLVDYLVRLNGNSTADVPPIKVQINTLLPADRMLPNAMPIAAPRYNSFYVPTAIALGILWLIGLVALLIVGRKKRRHEKLASAAPVSLADRLRPLVQQAMDGTIDAAGQAELDRLITSYWQRKLDLDDLSAPELREQLRQHPEAANALAQLDHWLYAPAASANAKVDINELLRPYQNVEFEPRTETMVGDPASSNAAVIS